MRTAVIVVVALAVRVVPVLAGGGLLFVGRYDDGVYYTAGAALADGRLPYRDFVLLHPPLIGATMVPFALLGRVLSDPVGLATARVVWMLLGAVSALAVARIADGWGRRAGWVAGILYACSSAVALPDQVTYIEPLGDLLVLLALMLLLAPDRGRSRRRALLVGILLGLSMAAKIWYVVPVAVVLGWLLVTRRWASAARVTAAAAVSATVVMAPFFLAAPRAMWQMVVVDQLTRLPGSHISAWDRLGYLTGAARIGLPARGVDVLTAVLVAAGLLALLVMAWFGDAAERLLVLVALGEVAVLLRVTVFIAHYAHFAAGSFVLVLVVGWARILAGRRRWGLAVGVGAMVVALVGGVAFAAQPTGRRLPIAQVRAMLPAGCVTADDPTSLVVVDRLSADLRAGCPVAVDVTGDSYGSAVYRTENRSYQQRLLEYLGSGSAAIVRRRTASGLSAVQVRGLGETILRAEHLRLVLTGIR